jgi:hypothetical protein
MACGGCAQRRQIIKQVTVSTVAAIKKRLTWRELRDGTTRKP